MERQEYWPPAKNQPMTFKDKRKSQEDNKNKKFNKNYKTFTSKRTKVSQNKTK